MSFRPTRFAAALQRAGSQLSGSAVRLDALRADAGAALQFARSLQGYRQYLAQARSFKAARADAGAGPGPDIDAEVLAHGRQAAADARGFASTGLRVVRSLHRGGALSRQVAVWRSTIQETGAVSIAAEWDAVSGLPETRAGFDEVGAGPGILASIDEVMRQTDGQVSIDGGHLLLQATVGGQQVSGAMRTSDRPPMPRDVVDLLTRGRFERMVDAVAAGEPAFLEGVGVADVREAGLPELTLRDGLALHREVVRHVRKLEDSGLATHRGGEPGTIFLIGLAVTIVGFALAAAYCHDHPPAGDPDKTKCVVAKIVQFLGCVLLMLAAGEAGVKPQTQPPDPLAMGGPVVHGVLMDAATTAL